VRPASGHPASAPRRPQGPGRAASAKNRRTRRLRPRGRSAFPSSPPRPAKATRRPLRCRRRSIRAP
jgi:hypothetical protein